MTLARQIADVLQDLCPGLSAEATAVALGIELCPAPCSPYCYRREPSPRVQYDAIAPAEQQQRDIERAIVVYLLDVLELRLPTLTSTIALTDAVFARLRLATAPAKRSA